MPEHATSPRSRWLAFGPGLLFAGAAVGVSHLVQSTRGGAEFGLVAAIVVAACCVLKWPAFRFGTLYAAATGDSLLMGYRRRGRWTLVVFGLITLAVCFTTLAAVTSVTAGLLLNLLPGLPSLLEAVPEPLAGLGAAVLTSIGLLVAIAIALATGGYRLLERVMKGVMPVLALATIVAAGLAVPDLLDGGLGDPGSLLAPQGRPLLVGVIGWMPAPIDIAVWSSIWTLARIRTRGVRGTTDSYLLDFDAGYVATMLLAIGFVVLGAGVMHGTGEAFKPGATDFAAQVVDLYARQLGDWTRPVIATAAFLTMLSTTLTVADGFPRAIAAFVEAWRSPDAEVHAWRQRTVVPRAIVDAMAESAVRAGETPVDDPAPPTDRRRSEGTLLGYWIGFVIVAAGAVAILANVLDAAGVGFKSLVDLVTTVSFLVAPVLVLFNHFCVTGPEMPSSRVPGSLWRAWSWLAFLATGVFATYYAATQWSTWSTFVLNLLGVTGE